AWLEAQCIAQWAQIEHGVLPGTVADVHAGEVASLMPPGRPFDCGSASKRDPITTTSTELIYIGKLRQGRGPDWRLL
ncbi:hypothetical protein QH494_27430, partial [Sphingomonas sp. AR_OL41]|nr:hypothetical protein [Sphingomonas sp. AR_OL41]